MDSLLDPHVFLEAVRDESGAIVDFWYVDANDAACAYNQLTREAMIGRACSRSSPGTRRPASSPTYAHVVETGEPIVVDGQYVLQRDPGESSGGPTFAASAWATG